MGARQHESGVGWGGGGGRGKGGGGGWSSLSGRPERLLAVETLRSRGTIIFGYARVMGARSRSRSTHESSKRGWGRVDGYGGWVWWMVGTRWEELTRGNTKSTWKHKEHAESVLE